MAIRDAELAQWGLANRRNAHRSATPSPDTITNPAGLVGDGTTGIAPGRVGVTVRVSVTVRVGVLVAVSAGVLVAVPVLVVVEVDDAVGDGPRVLVGVLVPVLVTVPVAVPVLTGAAVMVAVAVAVAVPVGTPVGVFVGPATVTCPFVSGLQARLPSFNEQPFGISGVVMKLSGLVPGATP